MTFDLAYAIHILPAIARAATTTIYLAMTSFVVAAVAGLVIAVLRFVLPPLAARALVGVADFIRVTPLLVQLYAVFYILPLYGLTLPAVVTGVAVLGIHYSVFIAEIYRAGIESIPRGQWEAAVAIGLYPRRTWLRIVLPQAIPKMIPPLGNYLIGIFKSIPVLATITIQDMFGVALTEASDTFRYLEPITLVGLLYLAMSLIGSIGVRRLEARYA